MDFLFCWQPANVWQESQTPAWWGARLGGGGRPTGDAASTLQPTRAVRRPVPGTGPEPWLGGRRRDPFHASEAEHGSLAGARHPGRSAPGVGVATSTRRGGGQPQRDVLAPAPHAPTTGRLHVTWEGDHGARTQDAPASSDPHGGPREA